MKYLLLLAASMACKAPVNQLDTEQKILLGYEQQSTIAPVVPVLQTLESGENSFSSNPTERSPTIRLFNIKPGDEVQLYSDSACLNPISERKSTSNNHLDISTHPLNMGNHKIYAKSWDGHGKSSVCSPHHIDFAYYVSPPTMTMQNAYNEEEAPTISLSNLYSGGSVQLFINSFCTEPLTDKKNIPEATNSLEITPSLSDLEANDQIYAQSWDSGDNSSPCSSHFISYTSTSSLPEPLPILMGQTSSTTGNTPTIYLAHLPLNGEFQLFNDSACTQSVSPRSSVNSVTMRVNTNPLPVGIHNIHVQAWDDDGNPSLCSSNAATFAYKVIPPSTVLKRGESSPNDPAPTLSLYNLYVGGMAQLFSDASCSQPLSIRQNVPETNTINITINPLTLGTHRIYSQSWDASGNPSQCSPHFTEFTYQPSVSQQSQPVPRTPRSTNTPSTQQGKISDKNFGTIKSPIYAAPVGSSINIAIRPSVSGRIYNLPSGERLTWKYSVQGRRGISEQNGICSISIAGTIQVATNNIQKGDACVVTVTVSASGYRSKSVSTSVYWQGSPQNSLSSSTNLKTFGTIKAPVYKKSSRGGGSLYGGKKIIEMQTKPSISVGNLLIDGTKLGYKYISGAGVVDFATLPNGDKLTWKYSIQHKRGGRKTDGICSLASNYGNIHVEEKKIKEGDACIVTATASAPGYGSKSVSTSVYWYGENDIRNVYTPPTLPQAKTFGTIKAPVYKKSSRGGGSLYGGKKIIEMQTKPSISVGNLLIDGTKLGYKYISGAGVVDFATLPNGDKLTWKYSIQHKRGGRKTDGICSLASNYGNIHVEEKKIKEGDACIVTATASAPGYGSKSVSTSVYWYGENDIRNVYTPPTLPQAKTFGTIKAPVYKKSSRGGGSLYGGKKIIEMQTKPSISVGNLLIDGTKLGYKYISGAGVVDFATLPNGDKLTWKYSIQHKRGGRKTDGICSLASNYGNIHVEEKKIKEGDACIVTATASAPGYGSKSVSTSVYWYGPSDIRHTASNTQSPSASLSPSPPPPASPSNPTPSSEQNPTKKFKVLSIRPPVFELKSNARAVGGKLTINMKSRPSYNGYSSHLSTGEKLTWKYSVQGLRGSHPNNDICFISSTGLLQVAEKNIKKGDNCKITYTIAAPGYHSISMTMNHFWQYIPVSQCQGSYIVRKNCKFSERIPYNWGNSFTHKCIKRDLVNVGTNTTGTLRCTGCVVSKEYPCY